MFMDELETLDRQMNFPVQNGSNVKLHVGLCWTQDREDLVVTRAQSRVKADTTTRDYMTMSDASREKAQRRKK